MATSTQNSTSGHIPDYAEVPNLASLFFSQARVYGNAPFLWARCDNAWQPLSWNETATQVTALARQLKALGITPGDRVAIISENRPEWIIADLAIISTGAVTVPAYTTNTVADHLHVLSDSGPSGIIVSTPQLAERVREAATQCSGIRFMIAIDPLAGVSTDASAAAPGSATDAIQNLDFTATVDAGREMVGDIAAEAEALDRSAPCCIIYTSGTSGLPRGVVLSHSAIFCNLAGARDFLENLPGFSEGGESFLSFLPLSHSFEHTVGLFLPVAIGAQIYFAESLDRLVANIEEIKPTLLASVPRLYELIHGRILRGLHGTSSLRQALFMKAVALGRQRYETGALNPLDRVLDGVLDRLVRSKVQARFGGNLKAFISGGAALNYEIGIFFASLGLTILQGYGQTEAAPVVSCNPPHDNRIATVGPPLKGVEVKIAGDGEILVRGALLMDGYWGDEEITRETLRDGWLHTGDVGVLDADGYIQITDRKKDIIVTSGGDNISPQRLEGLLGLEHEIGQAMVHGDRQPHPVALLIPDEIFAEEWCKEHSQENDMAVLVTDPDFRAAISAAVNRVNARLSPIERIRGFALRAETFNVDDGTLTPTQKIRRHVVRERHGADLDALYQR